jgi:hypothetical protein
MIIFPKTHIYPLLIPQQCFIDKYNNVNSYVEMNPSMFITQEGIVTILVRCVNYHKFYNKKFTMFENFSNSLYFIIKGSIINNEILDIENFDFNRVNYDYSIPTFNTFWKGLEDIRFITSDKILVTVPECNPSGNPSIFFAKLNTTTTNTININNTTNTTNINNFNICYPNNIEKNWMPYIDNYGNEKVIYSLNPFYIKNIADGKLEEINTNNICKLLENYHGSTNGIIYNENPSIRLFLIHINKEKTIHRWLLFNIETNYISLSEEFIFFKHSYIEFTCSLCEFNKRIFISIGINDNKAFIIETTIKDIQNILLL